VIVEPGGNRALGGVAASAFLERRVEPAAIALPGRLEFRGDEIRDGAHTPEAVRYIAPQLPPVDVVVASILADKDVDGLLRELRRLASVLVATSSSHPRALSTGELAAAARRHFQTVEEVDDPAAAVTRAHELGSPILVTGSLYLLADLSKGEEQSLQWRNLVSG
jgi:folylpolyglutamate synthase/dihydropteroate synthase